MLGPVFAGSYAEDREDASDRQYPCSIYNAINLKLCGLKRQFACKWVGRSIPATGVCR